MKIIKLPCYGIVINLWENDRGGIICNIPSDCSEPTNCFIDGVMSLILAHAIAGIDVESPAYLEGIESAVMQSDSVEE